MSAEGFEVLRQHMLAEICAGIFHVSGLIGKAALEGMSRRLLNIAKRSLPKLILRGVGLASNDAVG